MTQIKLIEQNKRQCFIDKARAVHGMEYDYRKVEYKNNKRKVTIICRTHGDFQQAPSSHLERCGCPKCGINKRFARKRMSVADFITKAQKKHNAKYNYDHIETVTSKSKLPIECYEHGIFMMEPWNHLSGQKCPKCAAIERANNCRSSPEEFISKARALHGTRYNYDNVAYINAQTKVIIRCEKHGLFEQTPDSHLRPSGCNKCASEEKGKERELGMDVYVNRAVEEHDGYFDYTLVPLDVPATTKVQIGCPKHGIFWQDFYQHSRGTACPDCYNDRRNQRHKKTEEFILDAKKIHGNKYDYSKANYINAYTKIEVICPNHSSFKITPTKHLSRRDGCPECGFLRRRGIGGITASRLKKDPELGSVDAWIYIARMENSEEIFFKFGITRNKTPEDRYSFFNTYRYTIEHAVRMSLCDAKRLEGDLKLSLKKHKPRIKFSGYTECTPDDPWALLEKLIDQHEIRFYQAI